MRSNRRSAVRRSPAPADANQPAATRRVEDLFERLTKAYAHSERVITERPLSREEEGLLDDLRFLLATSKDPASILHFLRQVCTILSKEHFG